MKIIWQGSDSLLLVRFPPQLTWRDYIYAIKLRIIAKIVDRVAQAHYSCGPLVTRNLKRFGVRKPIVYYEDSINTTPIVKKSHEGFNVLYYFPKERTKFREWIYGWDVFCAIRDKLPYINFIIVDGTHNMNEVYPIVDLMIRPCNHDGHSRMIRECILHHIPYAYTMENPDTDLFILEILDDYDRTKFAIPK